MYHVPAMSAGQLLSVPCSMRNQSRRLARPSCCLKPLSLHYISHLHCILSVSAGQLLSVALQHEQPELEARKAQLLFTEAGLTLQLAALEKQLLQALATSR